MGHIQTPNRRTHAKPQTAHGCQAPSRHCVRAKAPNERTSASSTSRASPCLAARRNGRACRSGAPNPAALRARCAQLR
jgi:hypothetical protein